MFSISSRKIKLMAAAGYCGVHIISAVLPIRSWPLTDYPMFAKPFYKSDEPIVHRFYSFCSEERRYLRRSSISGFGIGNPAVVKLYKDGEIEKFEAVLKSWLQKNQGCNRIDLTSVRFKKPSATQPNFQLEETHIHSVYKK